MDVAKDFKSGLLKKDLFDANVRKYARKIKNRHDIII